MLLDLPELKALRSLTPDSRLLFVTRIVRMFAYGFLAVVLVLYLAQIGLGETQIGLLLTLTLVGDALILLWITTSADRIGRRNMLVVGAVLMLFAGVVFAITGDFILLLAAAIIGVISPSGYEVGPFLSIEQASLAQITPQEQRTGIFAWYNLAGSLATALGSLCGGGLAQVLQSAGALPLDSYRMVVIGYATLGAVLGLLFSRVSPDVEVAPLLRSPKGRDTRGEGERGADLFGLHQSRAVVFRLSALFALDAFGGGFVVQSIVAYWFYIRFGVEPAVLGSIFFGANILAGISALAAARVAARIGLINTMVFTHIPSNILLMLVPLMPSLPLAVGVLLLRFSISQMDVPTRQSYTVAVVSPDERSAAAGVTGIARSVGASLAPTPAGALLSSPVLSSLPFFLAGGLKIVYDLLLYRNFKRVKPPEEKAPSEVKAVLR